MNPDQESKHEPTSDLQRDFAETLRRIQTLRDRLMVKLHLGGMELRDAWRKLEVEAEQASREVTAESHALLQQVVTRLRQLADAIDQRDHHDAASPRHAETDAPKATPETRDADSISPPDTVN